MGLGGKSLEGRGTQHVPTPLTQQRGLGGGYALLGADRLAARWSERTPRPCPHPVGNDSTWEDSGCQGQRVRPRGTYSTAAAATLRNQGKKMWALKGTRNTVTKAGQWGHGDLKRQWDAMRKQKCGGPSRWDPRQQRQHRKAVMLAGWVEMTSTSSAAPAGPLSFTTSQHQQLAALVDETAENPARGHPTMGFNPFKWTPEGAGSAFKMLPSTPKWTGPTSSYILIRITFLPLLHCQQLSTRVVPRPVYTSTRGLPMFDSCRPGGNVKCADLPCCCPTVSSQPRGHTRGNLPMK